ncbi:MAG: hypothetical protein CMJ62_07550 [Planctomycetaceae bacterium]|nr:hypothetical protein [Planctomycetaceae bacterium]
MIRDGPVSQLVGQAGGGIPAQMAMKAGFDSLWFPRSSQLWAEFPEKCMEYKSRCFKHLGSTSRF